MADGVYGLEASLARYIGETVTIFTVSGGLSGSGFTGILIAVTCDFVKLITQIAAPPACPLGSACTGPIGPGFGGGCGGFGGFGGFGGSGGARYGGVPYGFGFGGGYNILGSVTEIPIRTIASFTHNAV